MFVCLRYCALDTSVLFTANKCSFVGAEPQVLQLHCTVKHWLQPASAELYRTAYMLSTTNTQAACKDYKVHATLNLIYASTHTNVHSTQTQAAADHTCAASYICCAQY
jgi:hypothetical protein